VELEFERKRIAARVSGHRGYAEPPGSAAVARPGGWSWRKTEGPKHLAPGFAAGG